MRIREKRLDACFGSFESSDGFVELRLCTVLAVADRIRHVSPGSCRLQPVGNRLPESAGTSLREATGPAQGLPRPALRRTTQS
ncbi:protein of unknown function [Burkholderia multivorans]